MHIRPLACMLNQGGRKWLDEKCSVTEVNILTGGFIRTPVTTPKFLFQFLRFYIIGIFQIKLS